HQLVIPDIVLIVLLIIVIAVVAGELHGRRRKLRRRRRERELGHRRDVVCHADQRGRFEQQRRLELVLFVIVVFVFILEQLERWRRWRWLVSYLGPLRLHFSGKFQADVSTINNDVRHYDNETFDPNLQTQYKQAGTGAFRFVGCSVTMVGYADGSTSRRDPV